jgi:hypothetical protein
VTGQYDGTTITALEFLADEFVLQAILPFAAVARNIDRHDGGLSNEEQ